MSIGNNGLLGYKVLINGSGEKLTEVDLRDYLIDNPMTDEGDIIIGDALGVPAHLGVGDEDDVLTVEGGKPAWKPSDALPTATEGQIAVKGAEDWGAEDTEELPTEELPTEEIPFRFEDKTYGLLYFET